MPVRDDFKPGQFCWVDLMSHDLEAGKAWYGGLFGWTSEEQGDPSHPYLFFMKDGVRVGGGGELSDEMKAHGVPTAWNSYVMVEDCAASEAKVAELGATVTVPTTEVPGHGKLCYFLDPGGSSIAMWQQTGPDSGVRTEDPGSLSWNELMTKDVAKSRAFYEALFGWTFRDMPMGDVHYVIIESHGRDIGGMMPMNGPEWEGVPEHWMVYFATADCDATAAKVTETGGKVCVPPTDIPVGRFSVVSDPQGGAFTVIQLSEAASQG